MTIFYRRANIGQRFRRCRCVDSLLSVFVIGDDMLSVSVVDISFPYFISVYFNHELFFASI